MIGQVALLPIGQQRQCLVKIPQTVLNQIAITGLARVVALGLIDVTRQSLVQHRIALLFRIRQHRHGAANIPAQHRVQFQALQCAIPKGVLECVEQAEAGQSQQAACDICGRVGLGGGGVGEHVGGKFWREG